MPEWVKYILPLYILRQTICGKKNPHAHLKNVYLNKDSKMPWKYTNPEARRNKYSPDLDIHRLF